ncbi:putative receptor protein kinase zmpk1, partial [Quercus suber]
MTTIILLLLSLTLFAPFSSSTFSKGSSLISERPTYVLTSPDNVFSAGFYSVGENAFCFAIWFSKSSTVVWVADRDQPVNGKHSKLSLLKNSNLILTDASDCFYKSLLRNGYHSPDLGKNTYLRLPKSFNSNKNLVKEISLDCSREGTIQLDRTYVKNREKGIVKFLLRFVCGVRGLELTCIFVVWCLLIKTRKSSDVNNQGYGLVAIRFRKFTYAELKKATNGFTKKIRIGAWGVVYRG